MDFISLARPHRPCLMPSIENPLWGAPRIHSELLKLGFEVAQSSVAKYMVKRRGPPSQRWCTFLRNHAPDIAAMDLFIAPTIGFDLLYAFGIVRLALTLENTARRDAASVGPPERQIRLDFLAEQSVHARHKVTATAVCTENLIRID